MWEVTLLQARSKDLALFVIGLLAAWAFPLGAATQTPDLAWLVLTIANLGGLALLILRRASSSEPAVSGRNLELGVPSSALAGWALSITAGLYVGALLAPSIVLRQRPDGLVWTLLVIGATWACDTAAFFTGRRWGRHSFASTVSPQKSLEGAAAGLTAATLAALLGAAVITEAPARVVGLGLLVGIGAIFGDLAESALKRHLGAKDSGWIMLGHGGMLDRIDSLLFTGFLGYLYVTLTDGIAQV